LASLLRDRSKLRRERICCVLQK